MMSAQNRRTRQAGVVDPTEGAERFTMRRFQNIESVVKSSLGKPSSAIDSKYSGFLQKGQGSQACGMPLSRRSNSLTRSGAGSCLSSSSTTSPRASEGLEVANVAGFVPQPTGRAAIKPAVPSRYEHGELAPRKSTNFIRENVQAAIQATPAASAPTEANFMLRPGYGKMPDYLVQRRLELLREREGLQRTSDGPIFAEGMRLMSEAERAETVQILQGNRTEVINQINQLPLSLSTEKQVAYEQQLNKSLDEIDAALQVFDRKHVFVELDQ